jgi:small multidrug resistance pump
MPLILASLAALSFTAGGVFMKRADGWRDPIATAAFLLLFCAGAVFQSHAMRGVELGITYCLVLGLEAALAFAFGMFFFNEALTPLKAGSVLLIVSGIALLRAG